VEATLEATGTEERKRPLCPIIGRVGARAGFGWSIGTESEAEVVATTVVKVLTVAVAAATTVAVVWAEADSSVGQMSPIIDTNR